MLVVAIDKFVDIIPKNSEIAKGKGKIGELSKLFDKNVNLVAEYLDKRYKFTNKNLSPK